MRSHLRVLVRSSVARNGRRGSIIDERINLVFHAGDLLGDLNGSHDLVVNLACVTGNSERDLAQLFEVLHEGLRHGLRFVQCALRARVIVNFGKEFLPVAEIRPGEQCADNGQDDFRHRVRPGNTRGARGCVGRRNAVLHDGRQVEIREVHRRLHDGRHIGREVITDGHRRDFPGGVGLRGNGDRIGRDNGHDVCDGGLKLLDFAGFGDPRFELRAGREAKQAGDGGEQEYGAGFDASPMNDSCSF
jgi:hypothetical protein